MALKCSSRTRLHGFKRSTPPSHLLLPKSLWLTLVVVFGSLSQASAQMRYSIAADEGFASTPTCRTMAPGAFEDAAIWSCGRVPNRVDWAQFDHAVTFQSDIALWTLYVSPAGSLANVGVGWTITVSDIAPVDASQFDTGIIVEGALRLSGTPKTAWARTTAALASGAMTLTVDSCDGWRAGDRLIIGDTRELGDPTEQRPEELAIAGLTGCVVTLDRPLAHAYATARDHTGAVERLIPVGNLTRDITIRSENPTGHRGHLMLTGMATAILSYVSVQDMGRTTLAPLDPVANHIGRYALHLHHLLNAGAVSLVGTVVERSSKWGYVVHASNGNTLRENLAYDTKGWGFGTEDASEADNVFDRNLAIFVRGNGGGATETAIRGTGFWLQGPRNILTGNVSVNAQVDGFALYETAAIRHVRPLNTFRDNEAIANEVGIALWGIGSETSPSVIEHFMEWHNASTGIYGYGSLNLEFRDFYSRSDPSFSQAAGTRARNTFNWFGDYDTVGTIFTRPNIQNKDRGMYLPYGTASAQAPAGERLTRMVDGYFYNDIDLFVRPIGGSAPVSQPMRYEVVRPIHGNPTGIHYDKHYEGAGGDLAKTYRLVVTDYQRVAGDSFEVMADAQAPSVSANGACPVNGLTNQQCHDQHGISLFGDLLPTAAMARPRIIGKAVPSGTAPLPVTAVSESQADYSAFPICAQAGTDLLVGGFRWTIEPAPSFKVLRDGQWGAQRGLGIFVGPDGSLGVVTTTGRLARLQSVTDLFSWTQTFVPLFGCRLPTSASGSTVLQENGFLVDGTGGVWLASCAYTIPATFCPNFAGTTIEPAILIRNGVRLGTGTTYKGQLVVMGSLQSMPEPNNAPWNLCWSGGEMYAHVGNMEIDGAQLVATPTAPAVYARWLGLARYDWTAVASPVGCGAPIPPPVPVSKHFRIETSEGHYEGDLPKVP